MRCVNDHDNVPEAVFCSRCGAALEVTASARSSPEAHGDRPEHRTPVPLSTTRASAGSGNPPGPAAGVEAQDPALAYLAQIAGASKATASAMRFFMTLAVFSLVLAVLAWVNYRAEAQQAKSDREFLECVVSGRSDC